MNKRLILVALTAATLVAGCASSAILVGKARPPIAPDAVKLYVDPPRKFEQVALLESSSRASFSITDQGKTDVMVRRLKEEAAKLGANGVLLQGVGSQYGGSTGVATANGNTAFGVSSGIFHKAGNGVAIFVTEE